MRTAMLMAIPAMVIATMDLSSAGASKLTKPAPLPTFLNPLQGKSFWVNPNSAAAQAQATALQQGSSDAIQLGKLAAQPSAVWLTDSYAASKVTSVQSAVVGTGKVPVYVAYNIPGRDCGSYSSGGTTSAASYAAWISGVAAALGSSPAVVVLEPDAVALAVAGCFAARAGAVESMLKNAVLTLKARPGVSVYIDAGNPGWIPTPSSLVPVLIASGIASADGFTLNVSNFYYTSTNVAYGQQVSKGVGGKHFIVDTSRNGLGPLANNSTYPGPSWCNPPGRAVGTAPTSASGVPLVDALLWVKTPGVSDGDCGLGNPSAGTFWVPYAVDLVTNSTL